MSQADLDFINSFQRDLAQLPALEEQDASKAVIFSMAAEAIFQADRPAQLYKNFKKNLFAFLPYHRIEDPDTDDMAVILRSQEERTKELENEMLYNNVLQIFAYNFEQKLMDEKAPFPDRQAFTAATIEA